MEMEDGISDRKLKWFANNYASHLNKTERKIISYEPKDLAEIGMILSSQEYYQIIQKLEQKKAIVKRYKIRDFKRILKK